MSIVRNDGLRLTFMSKAAGARLIARALVVFAWVAMVAFALAASASAAPGDIPGKGFLADDRGWEKVSQAEKNSFDVTSTGQGWATDDGDGTVYRLKGVAPGSPGGNQTALVAARRDSKGGWTVEPAGVGLPEPSSVFWGLIAGARTSPLADTTIFWSGRALTPDAIEPAPHLYSRDNATGAYTLLTPQPGLFTPQFPLDAVLGQTTTVASTSAETGRVLYESPIEQAGVAGVLPAPGLFSPYLWIPGEGARLIGILPDEECGLPPCLPANGARVGTGELSSNSRFTRTALSRDGRRVYFYVPVFPQGNLSMAGAMYLRDDQGTPDINDDTTRRVNRSRRTDCAGDPSCGGDDIPDPAPDPAGPLPALFWGAETTRGARAIFTSCEQLTDDSTASAAGANCDAQDVSFSSQDALSAGRDLYLYDADTDELTDLTTQDANGADVYGVVGSSNDLSRIYFVAGGVLAGDAVDGAPNLYLWHDGDLEYLATLASDGASPVSLGEAVSDADNRNYLLYKGIKAIRLSDDGEELLITSRAPLTGYDNINPNACPARPADAWNPDGRCAEVYLYDDTAPPGAKFTCVSCGADGTRSGGDARLHDPQDSGAGSEILARNLSGDGTRVIFETLSSLVDADSNGRRDVYQWERAGIGSCPDGAADGGCVSLISAGTGSGDSLFVDATPSGDSVFFHTYDRLVAADVDEQRDVYVARVGGGVREPDDPRPPCREEGCQGPRTAPPGATPPGSSLVQGGGNIRQGPRASFRLKRPTAAQRGRLVRGKAMSLKVNVNRAGTVRATMSARLKRKVVRVGSASRRASRAGSVTLSLSLSKAARARLRRSGSLKVVLSVRLAGVPDARTLTLNLRRPA